MTRGVVHRALIALMDDGLPDLVGVKFREPDEDCHHRVMVLTVETADDLRLWAAALDLRLDPSRMSGDTMIHSAFGEWFGWRIVAGAFPRLVVPSAADLALAVTR